MKTLLAVVLLTVFAAPAFCAEPKKRDANDEREQLQRKLTALKIEYQFRRAKLTQSEQEAAAAEITATVAQIRAMNAALPRSRQNDLKSPR